VRDVCLAEEAGQASLVRACRFLLILMTAVSSGSLPQSSNTASTKGPSRATPVFTFNTGRRGVRRAASWVPRHKRLWRSKAGNLQPSAWDTSTSISGKGYRHLHFTTHQANSWATALVTHPHWHPSSNRTNTRPTQRRKSSQPTPLLPEGGADSPPIWVTLCRFFSVYP
jgi:hypothetical protein